MKQLNNNKSVLESLENKSSKKANETFIKLLAKNNAKKNPFDDARTLTSPNANEIKPGGNINDSL